MNPKNLIKTGAHVCRASVAVLFVSASAADAAVLYQSTGTDGAAYTNTQGGTPGTSSSTTTPFVIQGQSQGAYVNANHYPSIGFTAVNAADAGTQEIWVSFLMRRDSGSVWSGGLTFYEARNGASNTNPGFVVGWNSNANQVALRNGSEASPSAGVAVADGQSVAVLARLYENGTSGLFDRGDLYVDSNLADGVTFNTATVTGYVNGAGQNAILGALRLGADGTEVRSYDSITVATTQAEALTLIPEPSTALLGGLGLLALLRRRRA
ncbi:MAG: PEP-CTERM sorting domain-containing protein [Verrucomicrobiota bacterium]